MVVNQPVENKEDGDTEEEHEPEPEEEIDLLIDDVLGEDAEAVVSLLVASSSDIGDVTGHLCREDGAERVPEHQVPVLTIPEAPAVVLHHLQAKPTELVVQESVDQPELDDHQEEVEKLTEDEIAKVPIIVVKY